MHSVYLIDDEPLIIENLIKTIPWMENGFRVVGSNTDPDKAIQAIMDCRPDVVFSDLKMPSLSGVNLIKKLKEEGVSCEFVLLSAFGTFEDARKFFLMDGFDYLLKPLQQEDAAIVLERLSRKLVAKSSNQPVVSFSPTNNKSFDDLVRYVSENFNAKITLASLNKKFNISPNYICNLFAKHYNSTLVIFLTNLRMKAAAAQMQTTELPFKSIAVDCGYRDYFYFCRVFKEFYGVTPSQYREERLQDEY